MEDPQERNASEFLGTQVRLLRTLEFPGGKFSIWATRDRLPPMRAGTVCDGSEVIVSNRGLDDFQRVIRYLRPDLSDWETFAKLFEGGAPLLRMIKEDARTPDGESYPQHRNGDLVWVVENFTAGVLEQFLCRHADYGIEILPVGICEPFHLV